MSGGLENTASGENSAVSGEGSGQLPRECKTEVFDDGRVVVTAGSMGRGNWAIGDYSFVGGGWANNAYGD